MKSVKIISKGGDKMFFFILGYSIPIIAFVTFFFLQVFSCKNLLGPRMGSTQKSIDSWKRRVAGRKLEKKMFGIRDIWFWIE